MNRHLDRYRIFLETLTPETLDRLSEHVSDDVRFADPFNEVRGAEAMQRVFRHMFDNVGPVRFTVENAATDGDAALLAWRFEARLRGASWSFQGMSRVRFDPSGRVAEHIDHWDAASQFYQRLPVIGWLLALVRRRLAVR